MTLTKQDLQEWNSNPVTKQIMKEVHDQVMAIKGESVVRDTCDQTAMQAARNDGMIEGALLFTDAYESLKEATE